MEKITTEVFKSGDKLFLTEKECLDYEKKCRVTELSNSIINFLTVEGFNKRFLSENDKYYKHDGYFTTIEFLFVSDCFYINKYIDKDNKVDEKMRFKLCSIELFKEFYNELLHIKNNED